MSLCEAFVNKCSIGRLDQKYLDIFKSYLITPELINKIAGREVNVPFLQDSIDIINNFCNKRNI